MLEPSILRWPNPLQLIKLSRSCISKVENLFSGRTFSMACQALWILCYRQHTTTLHGFYCLLLHGRRSTGMVPRCGGIGFKHKLGAYDKINFEHQSLMHQWRLPLKYLRCTSQQISCRWPRTNYWCTNGDSHSKLHDSRIGNPIVGDPRIKDASATNSNGSRIKWDLKDPRTFQGLKNQWDLKDWRTIKDSRI